MFNFFTRSLVVLLAAMLSVNYIPDRLFSDFPLEPKSIESINFDAVIPQWNTKLSEGKPEYIQLNNILGPESIAISGDGLLYTGLADGRLVELDPSKNYKMRTVLRFRDAKEKCQDNVATRADDCGRFLQVRFVNGTLYAIEAGTGLYMIDIKTGSRVLLGPKSSSKVNIYNSFAFDPKEPNLVYVSVSSTKWSLLNIMWSILDMDGSGKMIVFDVKSGKQAILADNLFMPNGVDVDAKRDQLLISETMKGRILSVRLSDVRNSFKTRTDEKLSLDVKPLIPLLPGNPDNVIVEGDIAYIALPFVRLSGREFIDHLSNMPNVRKALGRFMFGLGKILEYISVNFYPHPLLESVYRELKCGHFNYRATRSDRSAVISYNLATGATVFMGSDAFGFVSEAVPDNKGNLYIGSFRSPFIVKQKTQ